jgi:hypothetical protein
MLLCQMCEHLSLHFTFKLREIIRNFVQEIDLRIGASFTRFQTMLLKDAFVIDVSGDDRNLVLSYGPCQVLHKTYYMYAHSLFCLKIHYIAVSDAGIHC